MLTLEVLKLKKPITIFKSIWFNCPNPYVNKNSFLVLKDSAFKMVMQSQHIAYTTVYVAECFHL